MSKSFFLHGQRVVFIANAEGADLRYRAHAHTLPQGVQVPTRTNDKSRLIFVIERGMLEFMVGGAVGFVSAGDLVRVAPGLTFAYRNVGDGEAVILSRCDRPARAGRRVTVEVAA
jgi:mannose-6-phosphate isomerase-like protein (cupin superfamily)